MREAVKGWRTWLRIGLCLGVLVALGVDTVDAGKKKDAGKKSHKLKHRELTDEQLRDLIQQYEEDVRSELEGLEDEILLQNGA